MDTWLNRGGHYGHNQIPGNTHVDPGPMPADMFVTPSPAPKPVTKPSVSLAHIAYAAQHDPAAAQGHTSYKAEVLLVERALQAEGLLAAQWVDGSFGSKTVTAYSAWQERLAYSGADADGIPGRTSLSKLGSKHGFTVTP